MSVGASARKSFLERTKGRYWGDQSVVVWLRATDGKVYSAAVYAMWLGLDSVLAGDHRGLEWWPAGDLDKF